MPTLCRLSKFTDFKSPFSFYVLLLLASLAVAALFSGIYGLTRIFNWFRRSLVVQLCLPCELKNSSSFVCHPFWISCQNETICNWKEQYLICCLFMGENGGDITKLRHEGFFYILVLASSSESPHLHFLIMPACNWWLSIFAGQALENWDEWKIEFSWNAEPDNYKSFAFLSVWHCSLYLSIAGLLLLTGLLSLLQMQEMH